MEWSNEHITECKIAPADSVTPPQICAALWISPRTLDRWRKYQGFPTYRISPRRLRFSLAEVAQWCERSARVWGGGNVREETKLAIERFIHRHSWTRQRSEAS